MSFAYAKSGSDLGQPYRKYVECMDLNLYLSPPNLDALAGHMEANGFAERLLGYKEVTSQYNNAKANSQESGDVALEVNNRRKEIQFKASHFLLIGFFSWILYVKMSSTYVSC